MKKAALLLIVCWLISTFDLNAQSLPELKKQLDESNYQKGNFYLTAFPILGGHFGKSKSGFGFSVGHSVDLGYFVANRLSVNFCMVNEIRYDRYLLNDYLRTESYMLAVPSVSLKWFVLNRRFTPFVEAGFNNALMYSETDLFDHSGFHYTGSAFAGIGINIPVANFNFSIAARYTVPIIGENPDNYTSQPYCSGLLFQPGVNWYFNRQKKKTEPDYRFD
jgi:hypothetical protein